LREEYNKSNEQNEELVEKKDEEIERL